MILRTRSTRFHWNKSTLSLMVLASGFTQIIGLVATLILGHLFLPSHYGVYSLAVNTASVLTPILTFSMEIFIVPSKSDAEARNYVVRIFRKMGSNFILLFVGILLLQLLGGYANLNIARNSESAMFGLFLALLYAIYSLVTQILLREEEFKRLTIRNPIQGLLIGGSQICLSGATTQNFGLVTGEYLGRIAGITLLAPRAFKILRIWGRHREPANKDADQQSLVLVNFASILFDLLSVSSVIFFTSEFFSQNDSGQVAMAQRILSLPIVLFGTVFSQYLLATESSEFRAGRTMKVDDFHLILRRLVFAAIPIFSLIYFLAPLTLDMLLGQKWLGSSTYMRYLIPATVVSFIWSPLSALFYVFREWNAFLGISMLRFASILLGVGLCRIQNFSLGISLTTITLCSALIQLLGILYLQKYCQKME